MRIAFVSPADPAREPHHSGSTNYLYRALVRQANVLPLKVEAPPLAPAVRLYFRIRNMWTGKRYRIELHPGVLRELSLRAQEAAVRARADVVLAIGQGYLTFWESRIPASFFSDTLYGAKIGFYSPWYRERMDRRQIRELGALGQQAVDRACKMFITSSFVVERTVQEIGTRIPKEKVIVTLVGANLERGPVACGPRPSVAPLRLLWVGVDWPRKGGDDCLAVLDGLRDAGIDAELHVVGYAPPKQHPRMIVHGFLRKDVPEEAERLVRLFQQLHLFLFPTKADLSPAVLAEAAATGLPSVSTWVGGVAELFDEGEIVLLDPARFREEAIAAILKLLKDGRLESMRHRVRRRFETHLNWDTIAAKIVKELEQAA